LNNLVLILAAHPDDEVLGCGGTISKLVESGSVVHVAFLSDGVFSREGILQDQLIKKEARCVAAKKACDILGVKTVSFGNMPDNRMDSFDLLDVVKAVEKLVNECKPEMIFTHHSGDVNIDHRVCHNAVVTACRPQVGCPVKTILSFEVPSSTEWQIASSMPMFSPNWFVDISDHLDRKLSALDVYDEELRDWPHPRSRQGVEYLARWRGATVGVDAAEAFMLGRQLV